MRISIVGAGKSGFSAAKLAIREGHRVFISERGDASKYQEELDYFNSSDIEYEFGEHTDKILDADMIVVSPGVPPNFSYFRMAEERDIPVVSELEFAYEYLKGHKAIIAVTGTNGKTTVVNIIHHILQESGHESILCGNVGTPLSDYVGEEEGKYIVVEASSYQLDRSMGFKPNVSVIMNLTPDHLSYHGTFVEYFKAKWKITTKQTASDLLVLNQDDPIYSNPPGRPGFDTGGDLPELETDAFVQYFSLEEETNGAYAEDGVIRIAQQQHKDMGGFMPISQIAIPGQHNLQNTLAAVLACRYLEIPDEDIRDSVASFKGVEHRLEHIAQLDGADWYNDSKATNINAAWYALSSFKRPIIWLAGGQGDSNDYHALSDLVKKNVKNVIAFGQDSYEIHSTYSSMVACDRVDEMQEAVQLANSLAEEGDIILLSPACKSFDQFLNFEDRGQKFKKMVKELL